MKSIFTKISYFRNVHFLPRGFLCFAHNVPEFVNISLLNQYQSKDWSIKGIVLKKDHIKTWSNSKGVGKLFSFVMIDDTCDVRVVAFNQEVNKFFDLIKVNKTYVLTNGIIKETDPRFNATKCDHEIALKTDSEIREVQEDVHIPNMKYNFVDIAHLNGCNFNTLVDVIGVAHEIKDTTTIITKKTNKELLKRVVILVDQSGSSVPLTLWGDNVKLTDNLQNPIIVVRGAAISGFNGLSLSVAFSSILKVNPENVPEVKLLLEWYQSGGRETTFKSHSVPGETSFVSPKATISEIMSNITDKGDYYTVEAVVRKIKNDNIVYKACCKCNKKLVDHNNGLYSCVKCDTEGPDFKYRLVINVNISDNTGALWLTAFHDSAVKLLGVSADEIGEMLENEQREEIDDIINDAIYTKIVCKVNVSNKTYNAEVRVQAVLYDFSLIDDKDVLVN